MRKRNPLVLLQLVAAALLFHSCVLSSEMRKPEPVKEVVKEEAVVEKVVPDDVYLPADELLISEETGDSRIIEIYKDEIQDNCEKKFFDLLSFYQNGELSKAKLLFDNLLESLEYLYGDIKVSDRVMLENFWTEFSDQGLKEASPNLFDIYESLYFDEDLFSKEKDSNELVIEQKSEVYQVRQNNANFTYAEEKTRQIFEKAGKKLSDDFIKSVYENYVNYLSDRIGIKETYIRSQKYLKFIKKKLNENRLNEIYSYIPAVTTSFYEGAKNGSIWRLENTRQYRSIRNDMGASTAEVIRKIKSLSKKGNEFNIIATILEEGKYGLEPSELKKDVYTDNFSNFIAAVIILTNPDDHDLNGIQADESGENDYLVSYEKYIKDPKKFTPAKPKVTEKPQTSKSSKSFIRINYKVRKGDNLQKVADLFKVSVSDLKEWNPKDTNKKYLSPGVALLIKGYNYQYYTAKSGDSLGRISNRFGMSENDFKKINDLSKNTIIKGRKYIVKKS
jgi:LysM repeat protein